MRTTITLKKILPLLLTALFMASCVGAPVKPEFDTSGLVWPPPPDPPRIKYVRIYKDNRDVEKAGFGARLLGGGGVTMRLRWPNAVAVDPEGRVYVSQRWGVVVFDTVKGEMRRFADEPGPGGVKGARGIAIAPDGRIFIADSGRKRVMVYSPKNKFIMQIGKAGEFELPVGVAIDPARNRLYVADAKKHSLRAYDLDGNLIFSIDSTQYMPEEEFFKVPIQVAVNSMGNIYFVSSITSNVHVYSPDGKFLRSFGGIGDAHGRFARPKGIAIDSEDNVYVTDAAFDNFQVFDSEDRLLTFVGSGGARPGEMSLPAMMHIDRHDRIYVTERGTHRVQVFQYMSDLYYRENPEERPKPPEEAEPEEAEKE